MQKSIEALLILGYDEKSINKIIKYNTLTRYVDDVLANKFKNIFKLLLDYGYKKEDIIKITISMPSIYSLSEEYINNRINFLVSLGYESDEVIKITKLLPALYCYGEENIKSKIDFMLQLGYAKEKIIKMTKVLPALYSLSEEYIKNRIDFMISLGYTKEEVIKMTKTSLAIYSYTEEKIVSKVNFLVSLGYTKNDVLTMTKRIPALYILSEEYIKNRINFIMSLGYTKEETLYITKTLTSMYSLSEESIIDKISYLKEIGLGFIVLEEPMQLIQSTKLTYARYEYLTKEKNMAINRETYGNLFMKVKRFENKYGISKQLLLEMYPYDKKYVDDSDEKIKNEADCFRQHVNIGTIGYVDHDKTTLAPSIMKELSKNNPPKQLVKTKKDNKGNK